MDVWQFISDKLDEVDVLLLYVLQSEGSSPGRKGFKMAVAADGTFFGTIGGGIMEHKLVEKARSLLQQRQAHVSVMWQYHDKEHAVDQSGMICSGSQLNAFIPLSRSDKAIIQKIIAVEKPTLQLTPDGININDSGADSFLYRSETDWLYNEAILSQPVIHIIGGGHVGLALSELMSFLGFYIKLYDDRPELNTIAANSFANEKHIIKYESIGDEFNAVEKEFVVIMTIGYRTDKIVLKQLIDKSFFYIGLLGSAHKIEILFDEMKNEGISEKSLDRIFSPIGMDIASKTTKEIAVSIAAEIIKERNKK